MTEFCKIRRVLVLCGAAHLEPFGNKLKKAGHQVNAIDVQDEPWIDLTWSAQKKAAK
jgi:hypothetical protein